MTKETRIQQSENGRETVITERRTGCGCLTALGVLLTVVGLVSAVQTLPWWATAVLFLATGLFALAALRQHRQGQP